MLAMAATGLWLGAGMRSVAALHAWRVDTELWMQEQAAESLALSWLAAEGGRLVAPLEGGSWTILADRWATAEQSGWMTVTVYDGWSGIPPHLAGPRGVLRRFVPDVLTGLPGSNIPPSHLGEPTDLLVQWVPPMGYRCFPAVPIGPWSTAQVWQELGITPTRLPSNRNGTPSPCLATVFSPHSDGRINCNTAPLPVVEQVLRIQGALTVADLRRNRERGVLSMPPPDPGGDPGHAVLVSSTGVWNLHITVSVQGRCRSWWVVVVGGTQIPHMVQRHVVDP